MGKAKLTVHTTDSVSPLLTEPIGIELWEGLMPDQMESKFSYALELVNLIRYQWCMTVEYKHYNIGRDTGSMTR